MIDPSTPRPDSAGGRWCLGNCYWLGIDRRACGAILAVLCNHAEIVPAHANRESPKSAALPFRRALIRAADVAMCSPSGED
jgi:hypothetical protein